MNVTTLYTCPGCGKKSQIHYKKPSLVGSAFVAVTCKGIDEVKGCGSKWSATIKLQRGGKHGVNISSDLEEASPELLEILKKKQLEKAQ